MRAKQAVEDLHVELEKVERAIVKPLELLSIAVLGAATALTLLQLVFAVSTLSIAVPLLAFGLGLSVAGRFCGRRAKSLILDLLGYRCASCGNTPNSAAATAGFPLSYCPHCQRKR